MNWTGVPFTSAPEVSDILGADFLNQFHYAMHTIDPSGHFPNNSLSAGDLVFFQGGSGSSRGWLGLRDRGSASTDIFDSRPFRFFGDYSELSDGGVLPVAERSRDYLYSFCDADNNSSSPTAYFVDAVNAVLDTESLDNISTVPATTGEYPYTRKYGATVSDGQAEPGEYYRRLAVQRMVGSH